MAQTKSFQYVGFSSWFVSQHTSSGGQIKRKQSRTLWNKKYQKSCGASRRMTMGTGTEVLPPGQRLTKKKHHLTPKTRWWFQPVWKILVKMEIFPIKWGRWLPSISCPLACRLQLWPGIRCTGFCTGKLLRLVVRKSELQNPREVGGKPLSSKHESYIYILINHWESKKTNERLAK